MRWWSVDHSIPGAVGFAVETSAGWVGFTGDIRFHARHGDRTWQFARELGELAPVALLCEGTHIEAKSVLAESDVVANVLELVEGAEGRLVVADYAPRNVERLLSFLEVARRVSRRLLVQPKALYLMQAIALADGSAFPHPGTLPELALYDDPKVAPGRWEVSLREQWAGETVEAEEVSRDPGRYLLASTLWSANDLLDLEGVDGGAYIYSNSRAYDDEQAADLERLRNWVQRMGFTLHGDPDDEDTLPLHASGHAPGPQLVEFVETVDPQMLIPIHTEYPLWWVDQLDSSGIDIRLPQLGAAMPLN
jgi:ribonuclease J